MSVPVRVETDALEDIRQARRYYDKKRAGLGDHFVRETWATIGRIADNPLAFAEERSGVRGLELHRFGYVVYYRTNGTSVEVIAIVHGSRPPEAWQDRLAP